MSILKSTAISFLDFVIVEEGQEESMEAVIKTTKENFPNNLLQLVIPILNILHLNLMNLILENHQLMDLVAAQKQMLHFHLIDDKNIGIINHFLNLQNQIGVMMDLKN